MGASHKGRQMAAFFLHDQPVLADWSDDGYIFPRLNSEWRKLDVTNCSLIVQRKNNINILNNISTIGSLVVLRVPKSFASKTSISGGHGVEMDDTGWWSWCQNNLIIEFKIHTKNDTRFSISFQAVPISVPRDLEITVSGVEDDNYNVVIPMIEGWNRYDLHSLKAVNDIIKISFEATGESRALSPTDSRSAKFLIKNVDIQFK
jgi:hypothetical protein